MVKTKQGGATPRPLMDISITSRKKNLRRLRKVRRKPQEMVIPDRRVYDPPKNLKVAIGTITDPYASAEFAKKLPKQRRDGTPSPGEGEWFSPGQPQITVLRSIRADPLGWMHSHSQIDEAEYLAARRWQWLYERSHVGSVQAVDTSKEPVDGGRFPELMTETQRQAIDQLRSAARSLLLSSPDDRSRGVARAQLIQDVLGGGMFIKTAAAARGIIAERAIGALAKEFHQSLSVLAVHFGYAGASDKTKNKIRGWRNEEVKNPNKENKKASQGKKIAA